MSAGSKVAAGVSRERLVQRARTLRGQIEDYFRDASEAGVDDADPDGKLASIHAGLSQMLAVEQRRGFRVVSGDTALAAPPSEPGTEEE